MSNSKLVGKEFELPDKVLAELNKNLKKFADQRDSKGFNRAIFLINKKSCSYEQMKRIKNYFDTITDDNFDEVEYLLNGGDIMKKWLYFTLDQARKSVYGTKSARKNAGMSNQFLAHNDDQVNPVTPTLKKTPEFMSTSDLMLEINKIKELTKKMI